MKVTLHIKSRNETKAVEVDGELSIGRTPAAQLVLDDEGLSRVNTTVFIEGDEVLAADENSTNGTFLNGGRITGRPRLLTDGDTLKIGTHTEIRVEIDDGRPRRHEPEPAPVAETPKSEPAPPPPAAVQQQAAPPAAEKPPYILVAAGVMTLLIVIFAGLGFFIASGRGNGSGPTSKTPPTGSSRIPARVMDPLGGEDEEDLDDIIASWENAEEEIKAENVVDVSSESKEVDEAELNVTAAFLADRQRLALGGRPPVFISHPQMDVPKELFGDGVIKQKAKLREMKGEGYQQPLDFADLAEKRLNGQLLEMPMAMQSFYLDVGGSASDGPFQSFRFPNNREDILGSSPKYGALSQLASKFGLDLNNAAHRKQIRMRLLRMFNPKAKPILKELADAYFGRFGRPLRVTSLTRSIDYQILLNANNANSFMVRDSNSLPPHTSGCAFDLARKHMPPEEQNFLMQKLADMENQGRLDALIEYGVNACFHVFIYDDGSEPKM